jgi:hypothetical protein
LQGVEHLASAPKREVIVGQSVDDLVESHLHSSHISRERGTRSERIVATKNPFGVPLTLVIAVMVEAEFLAAKGGRATRKTVELAMIAGGKGHEVPQKNGLFAFRHLPFRKRPEWQLEQAVGMPSARSNRVRAGNLYG